MALDNFIKIADIQGESQDSQFKDQIEIMSYSFGASMVANVGQGGLGAGKVSFSDFTFVKQVDKASPKFFKASCVGSHLATVVFSTRKAGGGSSGGYTYLQITLSDALVTQFHLSGASEIATESVSLAFAKLQMEYFMQTATGSVGSTGAITYDVTKNQAT